MLGRRRRGRDYEITGLRMECFVGRPFGKGDTLESMECEKNQREAGKGYGGKGKKIGRVACGYELISFNVFLKDWSRKWYSF